MKEIYFTWYLRNVSISLDQVHSVHLWQHGLSILSSCHYSSLKLLEKKVVMLIHPCPWCPKICRYNICICHFLDELMMWSKIVLHTYINILMFEFNGKIPVHIMDHHHLIYLKLFVTSLGPETVLRLMAFLSL